MWRQDYQFELPESLIARRPPVVRGDSRLMVLPGGDGAPEIRPFERLLDAFRGDEVLVLNDTRVVPARVRGRKASGGAVELFVVDVLGTDAERGEGPEGRRRVEALLRGKRLSPGTRLVLPGAEDAVVVGPHGEGTFAVDLSPTGVADVYHWLEAVGEMPLPPYLDRPADEADRTRYQTVFARAPGAVAAPTAGLHFTDALLDALRAKGVAVTTLTLHVGLGTFLPVRVDDLDAHVMHEERYDVPAPTRTALASGRPVVAVGTTVVRALESFARDPEARSTRIFIRPGFEFRVVDGLVTNFHLPESTLLMLVGAFAGRERVLDAYACAVRAEMRFFSYGDAMLLRRPGGRWT